MHNLESDNISVRIQTKFLKILHLKTDEPNNLLALVIPKKYNVGCELQQNLVSQEIQKILKVSLCKASNFISGKHTFFISIFVFLDKFNEFFDMHFLT